tara:strand:- start:3634 stop:3921 length:288 start_codon:yes stop_codon:yes gene_type:complete
MDTSTATEIAEILAIYNMALLEMDRELKGKVLLEEVEKLRALKDKVKEAMVLVAERIGELNALLVEGVRLAAAAATTVEEVVYPFEGNVLFSFDV